MNDAPIISVFGSASPLPGDPDYALAEAIGRKLALANFTVQTGGYCGTMEAVSKGANEAGGHVIGITSAQIEAFRPLTANEWVVEEIKYPTLQERLLHVVCRNAGAIILPGGIGTLAELALIWNFVQTGELSARPIAAIGSLWRDTLATFVDPAYVRPQYVPLITIVDSTDDAVAAMSSAASAA